MSTLLKWAQNTTQSNKNKNTTNGNGGRNWIHPPDTLQKGHIAYLVKFMGNTSVDQPKGIEVVKEAIRKLQFSAQLRKAETGNKQPNRKVELTISVDGVAIQEPRKHVILHQFPLHRISYCADDKGEKRFFSFIAKQPDSDSNEDKHECFVFISDKLAEEITLTIGQAFELAYKRFLDTSGKDLEAQRRVILNQQRVKRLEHENNIYKQRLLEICQFTSIRAELEQYLKRHNLKNALEIQQPAPTTCSTSSTDSSVGSPGYNEISMNSTDVSQMNGTSNNKTATEKLLDVSFSSTDSNGTSIVPPIPPRRTIDLMGSSTPPQPIVGTRLEGLLLSEFDSDQDFDPRSFEQSSNNISNNVHINGNSPTPLLAPPPKTLKRQNGSVNSNNTISPPATFGQDLFGSAPFNPVGDPLNHSVNVNNNKNLLSPNSGMSDPFEMGDFGSSATQQDLENAIGLLDKRILEMKDGFSRGISFGNDDFSLESLDPLKN